ncbi:DNase I superfamily protein, putative [Medicago truncatula]|uniref:DNase I superfamily protein, putative n=1 Tax=Medicago truncatula TaxID=3880 RepID=A0A072VM50_MEDTR|nr:DNase I superfamily protein, putative [Medicago truncatula]
MQQIDYVIFNICFCWGQIISSATICFTCSHQASGEKEDDELYRNLDVQDKLNNT